MTSATSWVNHENSIIIYFSIFEQSVFYGIPVGLARSITLVTCHESVERLYNPGESVSVFERWKISTESVLNGACCIAH